MADLAETILPAITSITDLMSELLDWFNSLPKGAQAAIGVVLLFVAAISPIAGLIANIAIMTGIAGGAMTSFLPIILAVTAALIALAVIIATITGKSEEMNRSLNSVGRGSGFGGRSLTLSTEDVPHLASGGVAKKNSPFLAVVGDNTQEDEIIAPYSTVKRAATQGILESGVLNSQRGPKTAVMALDGRTFARLETPYILEEFNRIGVKFQK